MPSISIEVYDKERPTLLLLTLRFWPSSNSIPLNYTYEEEITLYGRRNYEEVTEVLLNSRCTTPNCNVWCVLGLASLRNIELWDDEVDCFTDYQDNWVDGSCSVCQQSLEARTEIRDNGPEKFWDDSSDDEDHR